MALASTAGNATAFLPAAPLIGGGFLSGRRQRTGNEEETRQALFRVELMAELDDFTREEFRRTLQSLMSDISGENWAAVWMTGTEFDLWAVALKEKPFVWKAWSVREEDRVRLRMLSRRLYEWVIWDDDGVRPIPLAEWKPLYEARRRANQ